MLDGNVASVRWLSSIMVDPPNKQCLLLASSRRSEGSRKRS